MGTKNNPPPKFDCYAKAEPDEPMFVLLGRDPLASLLVGMWAEIRREMGEDPEQIAEADACSDAMLRWAVQKGKTERVKEVVAILDRSSRWGSLGRKLMSSHQRVTVDSEVLALVGEKVALELGIETQHVRAFYYHQIKTVIVGVTIPAGKEMTSEVALDGASLAVRGLLPDGTCIKFERYL